MRGLKTRRIVITGGASGIGRATARRLLGEGAQVTVLDRAAADPELKRLGARFMRCDITDPSALTAVFDAIGALDVLINNAGVSHRAAAADESLAQWRRTMAVNLDGLFHCAQLAAARMTSGVIINMGSVSGLVGMPQYAAYNASKAAVIELTRTLALEWAPAIRVVCICPGYVMTPMQRREYTEAMLADVNRRIPLRRHARPEEIAALMAFVASDEAPYMTGSAIVIDGGETAGGLASS